MKKALVAKTKEREREMCWKKSKHVCVCVCYCVFVCGGRGVHPMGVHNDLNKLKTLVNLIG